MHQELAKPQQQPMQSGQSLEYQYADQVIELVTQCFNSLNVYGKTADELPGTIKLFLMVLREYPIEQIQLGFAKWIKRNATMPTPADIVNIIHPEPQQWKPDWPAYIALKKRVQTDGYYVYGKEKEFLRLCENYAVKRSVEAAKGEEKEALLIMQGKVSFIESDYQ